MKKALYAGSFDPITYEHKYIIQEASHHVDELIVGIETYPKYQNIFSLDERIVLTRQTLADSMNIEISTILKFEYEHNKGFTKTQHFSDIHSDTITRLFKEGADIRSYVPLNIKQALEGRILGQYTAGITGTIGSGKSYATRKFIEIGKKYGIPVHDLDMDKIGHDILGPSQEPLSQGVKTLLTHIFGDQVNNPDGSINRQILGSLVFSDPVKLQKLNTIIHTPMQAQLKKEMADKQGLLLYNAALIAETNNSSVANNNILLFGVDTQLQKERLTKRGSTPEDIERRISSQYSTEIKAEVLDAMIAKDKRGSLTTLSGLHTDQELEQEFNLLLMKVDMFGELRFSGLLNRLGVQEDPRQCFAQLRELYESLGHIQSSVISSLNIFYTSKHLIKDSEIAECAIIFSPIVSNSTTKHDGIIILETLFMQWGISKNLIEKIMYAIITPR